MQRKQNPNTQQRVPEPSSIHLSAIIQSLLSALESTRHLYHRIKNDEVAKSKKSQKLCKRGSAGRGRSTNGPEQLPREAQLLQSQLQRAPTHVARVFKRNSDRLGEGYKRGDERAKTSLNRILLVLNTGLTKIISNLLGKSGGGDHHIYCHRDMIHDLMLLSERSVRDSVVELEGFRRRLESMASLNLSEARISSLSSASMPRRYRRHISSSQDVQILSTARSQGQHQGRTSAGSNSTELSGQKQKTAPKAKKTPSQSSILTTKPKSSTTGRTRVPSEIHPVWVRSKNSSTVSIDLRRSNMRTRSANDTGITGLVSQRQQLGDISRARPAAAAAAAATKSTPNLPLQSTTVPSLQQHPSPIQSVQSVQPTPLWSRDINRNPFVSDTRDEPLDRRLSMLSRSSASTKVGEIPQHKWINPWIPPVEIDEDDKSDGILDARMEQAVTLDAAQRARAGVRFWRRFGRNRS